jgi:cell wall assembly regulator SMI1
VTANELANALIARDDVVIGRAASEAEIDGAQQALGVTFPQALREYLLRFGHLELGHFELYGLGTELPKYLQLVAMTVTERIESGCPLPHEFIPILNDGGGNLYCIGTQPSGAGRVVLWVHTLGVDQDPEVHAASLLDWINDLLTALDQG